jgi:hypothetical protein
MGSPINHGAFSSLARARALGTRSDAYSVFERFDLNRREELNNNSDRMTRLFGIVSVRFVFGWIREARSDFAPNGLGPTLCIRPDGRGSGAPEGMNLPGASSAIGRLAFPADDY